MNVVQSVHKKAARAAIRALHEAYRILAPFAGSDGPERRVLDDIDLSVAVLEQFVKPMPSRGSGGRQARQVSSWKRGTLGPLGFRGADSSVSVKSIKSRAYPRTLPLLKHRIVEPRLPPSSRRPRVRTYDSRERWTRPAP